MLRLNIREDAADSRQGVLFLECFVTPFDIITGHGLIYQPLMLIFGISDSLLLRFDLISQVLVLRFDLNDLCLQGSDLLHVAPRFVRVLLLQTAYLSLIINDLSHRSIVLSLDCILLSGECFNPFSEVLLHGGQSALAGSIQRLLLLNLIFMDLQLALELCYQRILLQYDLRVVH